MSKVIDFFKELIIVNLLVAITTVFTNGIVSFFDEPLNINGCIGLLIASTIMFCVVSLISWIVKPKQR